MLRRRLTRLEAVGFILPSGRLSCADWSERYLETVVHLSPRPAPAIKSAPAAYYAGVRPTPLNRVEPSKFASGSRH